MTMPATLAINPEHRVRLHLAQFTSELLQALLRCGKFAQAPLVQAQAQRRPTALHALFSGLMKDRDEFCLSQTAVAGSGILIEGVLPEPVAIGDLLRTGVGAAHHPMLTKLFGERGLASLTLSAGIGLGELSSFLQDFGRLLFPPQGGEGRSEEEWLFAGLPNVSVLWANQLVDAVRPMRWSVRLALSRLRCEWEVAVEDPPPVGGLGRHETDGPAKIRRRAIERAVKSVGQADCLAELMLHADLVSDGEKSARELPVETEIIGAIPPPLLGPILGRLSRTAAGPTRAGDGPKDDPDGYRLRRILTAMAEATLASEAPGSDEGLAAFFRARAIPLQELSAPLKDFIVVRHLARGVLDDTSETVLQLRRDPAAHAALLGPVVAELVRKEHYAPAVTVLALALDLPSAAPRIQEVFYRTNLVPLLLAKLEAGPREARARIADMLVLLDALAVQAVIDFLARSAERGARRIACDVLARIGAPAVPALATHLERNGLPWYVARNLLLVLGTVGHPVATDLRRWLRHGEPRVREAAIQAIAQIYGREAEGALVGLLRDANVRVRTRAVKTLADLQSTHTWFQQFLMDAIRRKALAEREEDEQIQIFACGVVQRLGNAPGADAQGMERTLGEALEARPRRGLLGVLGSGGFRPKSPAVRAAIGETLAALSSPSSERR